MEGYILISEMCPPHVQRYDMHAAIEMHSSFGTVARAIEIGSFYDSASYPLKELCISIASSRWYQNPKR